MPEAVDEVIEAYHRALDGFVRGDPEPLKALFSQRDDVTLANPFGPAQRGWRDVAEKMTLAAENYRDGRALGFDQIASYVTAEIACIGLARTGVGHGPAVKVRKTVLPSRPHDP